MKTLFCTDLGADKKTRLPDGEEFIVRRVSEEQSRRLDEAKKKLKNAEASLMPPALMRLLYALAHVPILVLLALMGRRDSINYGRTDLLNERMPVLLPLCVVCIAYILFFRWYKKRRVRSEKVLARVNAAREELNRARQDSFDLFSLPQNGCFIDILRCGYFATSKGTSSLPRKFDNFAAQLELRENTLYVSDAYALYAIPCVDISEIKPVEIKDSRLERWNKPESMDCSKYASWLKLDESGRWVLLTAAYALCFLCDGEEYEMLFPAYELKEIEKLTGLTCHEIQ